MESESIQEKFVGELAEARAMARASELSEEHGVAYVIESRGVIYVETETPFVRTWERMRGRYAKGAKADEGKYCPVHGDQPDGPGFCCPEMLR